MPSEREVTSALLLAAGRRERITLTVEAGTLYDALLTMERLIATGPFDETDEALWRTSARQMREAVAEALGLGGEEDERE